MTLVDAHLHVFSDDPARYPYDGRWGMIPTEPTPVEELIACMDANGVDKAVMVQGAAYLYDNRYMADCRARFPDRLAAVARGPLDVHLRGQDPDRRLPGRHRAAAGLAGPARRPQPAGALAAVAPPAAPAPLTAAPPRRPSCRGFFLVLAAVLAGGSLSRRT